MRRTLLFVMAGAFVLGMTSGCSLFKKEAKADVVENASTTASHGKKKEDNRIKLSKKILDGEWTIAEVGGKKVTGEERPYINFSTSENRIYGSNGCNIINGGFQVEPGNLLSFGEIISTMKACADAPFETAINQGLSKVYSYAVEKRGHEYYLNLYDAGHHKLMVLRKHNMDYLNGAWRVEAVNNKDINRDDVELVIDIPELKLHGNSGCNILNGALWIDPDKTNSIQFQQIATTRMMCDEASMDIERSLLVALEEVESAKKKSNKVFMYDKDGHEVIELEKIPDK